MNFENFKNMNVINHAVIYIYFIIDKYFKIHYFFNNFYYFFYEVHIDC